MKSRIYRGFHNNGACGIFDLSTFHRWISKIYNNIKIIFFDFYFLLLSLIRFKLFYPLSKLFQTTIPPIRTMQIELRRNKITYAFSTILVVNKNSILRKRYTFRIKKAADSTWLPTASFQYNIQHCLFFFCTWNL